MRSIAIASSKGGCAKSTTAVHLAACLATKKRRVLILDLDPGAGTSWWLGEKDPEGRLLSALLSESPLVELITTSRAEGVDLLPGGAGLACADQLLSARKGSQFLLRKALKGLPDRWPFILLDCGGGLSHLTLAALVAAGELLLCTEPSVLGLDGIAGMLSNLETVQAQFNPALRLTGILLTQADLRTRAYKVTSAELSKHFGHELLESVIRRDQRVVEAPASREPLNTYAPASRALSDYKALAREILRRG
jgi:chromosome partitioning protein